MTVGNVRLILAREIRDQLRDRRTLFMIFVLPVLLYPLLGMSFLQVSQFMQERPTRIWVVGARSLDGLPPLVENNRFAKGLFDDPDRARLLVIEFAPGEPREDAPETAEMLADPQGHARRLVQSGAYDAALYIPPDFDRQLDGYQEAIRRRAAALVRGMRDGDVAGEAAEAPLAVPSPEIIYNTANEKSLIAYARLAGVLRRWTDQVGAGNLAAGGLPVEAARPFQFESADVADGAGLRGAATWAKILPMLLVLWAMTGAFYPAVDLCAGEKERGTLETLLSSPARRGEIVLGKLATIMLFSMITAVLNLVSMGATGWMALSRMPGFGPPPPLAVLWLAVALVPVSALFSALCLALAAFARSTKEGQYYLMPLMLVTMPLVVLPMAPGVELNLGTSLVPVTGVAILLRNAIEGNYWLVLQYVPVVAAVTLACCALAVRWAVDQFNSESVLFREGEQVHVGHWLRHLVRDRQATPTVAAAVFCGMVILTARFFLGLALPQPTTFGGFAATAMATQLVVVLAPALLMTAVFARGTRETLALRWPAWWTMPAAALLALALHPTAVWMQGMVMRLYPPSEDTLSSLLYWQQLILATPWWTRVALLALTPAICEELAFRGFILSGFRHIGHKWRAIVFSSLLFGFAHAVLQQSLLASLVGMVIGYVAIQSGSILPPIVFHLFHNGVTLVAADAYVWLLERWPGLDVVLTRGDGGEFGYPWPTVVGSLLVAVWLLRRFSRLPYRKSSEEQFEEALRGEAVVSG